ncbi:hypothetical protein C731_3400 [Mycolicibacterium hassiacum DSM 44199]|uniref:Uncharacterized protein n=1 Tax=Mycolicibacterium hassiacum (strain DSM 44199 / CIP 105218 / JCM 12690 / 3849) TaxID=1122247 RepID=K5BAQ7_MYCHD|nr:hypothetical protein C731_3400 [Mycolicibacterium hassiacum DSM 44199]
MIPARTGPVQMIGSFRPTRLCGFVRDTPSERTRIHVRTR